VNGFGSGNESCLDYLDAEVPRPSWHHLHPQPM